MPISTANSIIQSTTQTDIEDGQGTSLADLILEKIAAQEAIQTGQPVVQGGGEPEEAVELPAKVVEVYTKCAWLTTCNSKHRWLTHIGKNWSYTITIQEWSTSQTI